MKRYSKNLFGAIFLIVLTSNVIVAQDDLTVYVTKTGSKYHKGTCSSLRKSAISMKLSEAVKTYEPCSRCNPPMPNADKSPQKNLSTQSSSNLSTIDNAVYVTRTGSKYHRIGCGSLSKSCIKISLEKAVLSCDPCFKCKPPIVKTKNITEQQTDQGTETITQDKKTPQDRIIYTGPRGGKYYINSKGKKVYIRKKK